MTKYSLKSLLIDESKFLVYLNSNGYQYGFKSVYAKGSKTVGLKEVEQNDCFGLLSYDLKETFNSLKSDNYDFNHRNETVFFKSEAVFEGVINDLDIKELPRVSFRALESKEEYLTKVNQLKKHLHDGDIYEINYCTSFVAENVQLNPIDLYAKLNDLSPMPFSGLFKNDDVWVICASPERFLTKEGQKVISQPIKGTMRRGSTTKEDDDNRAFLEESDKERGENLMIVDLVRNDLNRICKTDTVKVPELFGIYPYPRVFQMISTVEGEIQRNKSFNEVLRATFPMGSMTGAPKLKAMQLIEKYENFRRGYFSGSLGWFKNGDFDFNVIIRSLIYNESRRTLTFSVGSAITFLCDAEQEYEECLLKASAIQSCFSS